MNYDFRGFHKGCAGVYVVGGDGGFLIVCPDCRVAANLEAVSGKVTPADACKVGLTVERQLVGKLSSGVEAK